MSFTLRIEPYQPIPLSIVVSEQLMEVALESFVEKYGVLWNAGKRYAHQEESSSATSNEEGSTVRKRNRTVFHIWYKAFSCHRAGGKAKNSSRTLGANVVFTFEGSHHHDIGSSSNFAFLPVSQNTKNFIFQQLREGYMCRDVRLSIQRQLTSYVQQHFQISVNGAALNEIVHRDQVLDPKNTYRRAVDQKESVKLWLRELREDQYLTFLGTRFDTDFTFGFFFAVATKHPNAVSLFMLGCNS
ncbi:uncharacterized protein BX663DRAFT_486179 [Cokeromyces recurvatus]|uniref:uncharacterized protein n=1 Tax=Cokeromyces recurvatus TaxID=90255 RepID=UPI00221EFDB3|nr:uncharacterized protein BX663DRAFT_486179 [Cokeromyces recurvatus]KAI7902883.1 hypothetical protein BX663DRAFT_486179 [Cokeromyces recurvatus]